MRQLRDPGPLMARGCGRRSDLGERLASIGQITARHTTELPPGAVVVWILMAFGPYTPVILAVNCEYLLI